MRRSCARGASTRSCARSNLRRCSGDTSRARTRGAVRGEAASPSTEDAGEGARRGTCLATPNGERVVAKRLAPASAPARLAHRSRGRARASAAAAGVVVSHRARTAPDAHAPAGDRAVVGRAGLARAREAPASSGTTADDWLAGPTKRRLLSRDARQRCDARRGDDLDPRGCSRPRRYAVCSTRSRRQGALRQVQPLAAHATVRARRPTRPRPRRRSSACFRRSRRRKSPRASACRQRAHVRHATTRARAGIRCDAAP